MKRYDAIARNNLADNFRPSVDGDVVPASVAQALYDALKELDAFCEVGYSNGKQIDYVGSEEMKQALEALSLADGEE